MHLVADDNRVFRNSLKRILGPATRGAATPDEAIDLIAQEPPRVVIMDVCFGQGGEDGIEAIPRIKLISPLTQVVVCSGYYSEADAARAKKYGAFAYVEKIGVASLLAVVAAATAYASDLVAALVA